MLRAMMDCRKVLFLFALILTSFCTGIDAAAANSEKVSIFPQGLRCEYLVDPKGLDELQPRLSWTLAAIDSNAFGQRQTAYRILVSSSEDELNKNRGDIWDSDWVRSDDMQHIVYRGKALQSDKSYFWKVVVKDEQQRISAWSKSANWTTGLLRKSDWTAKWIGSDELFDPSQKDCNINDPWFRKTVHLKSKPKKAVMFVASVGFHEVYVNGKKIGDHILAPAVTDHTKRARYIAYDLAPELKKGRNVIAVWLGTSWSIHGPYVSEHRPNTPILIGQANF